MYVKKDSKGHNQINVNLVVLKDNMVNYWAVKMNKFVFNVMMNVQLATMGLTAQVVNHPCL